MLPPKPQCQTNHTKDFCTPIRIFFAYISLSALYCRDFILLSTSAKKQPIPTLQNTSTSCTFANVLFGKAFRVSYPKEPYLGRRQKQDATAISPMENLEWFAV
jgi:hypothetical protein